MPLLRVAMPLLLVASYIRPYLDHMDQRDEKGLIKGALTACYTDEGASLPLLHTWRGNGRQWKSGVRSSAVIHFFASLHCTQWWLAL